MRKFFIVLSLLSVICLNIWSQSFSIQKTIPEANSALEYIQEITLIFDLDSYKADNPSIANWYIGCNVWDGDPIIALKDSKGDILAQIMNNDDLSEGDSFTFSFENPVILSPNEQYTLVISEYSFSLYSQPNFKGYTADNDEYEIQFYGSQSSSKVLALTEVTPAANSVCANLDVVDLYFNEQIEIASGSKAYLYDVNSYEPIGESEIKLNEDEVSINLSFKDISLLYSHSYYVEIPANSIFLKGDLTNSYQKISIKYSGSEYTYFGYGRISPANNRSLEYISTVTVPVNCSDDEYLGRDFKATANLYKVDNEEQTLIRSSIECAVTENSKGFYINVYDFDLEPESTYRLVVDADQFYFWSYETQRPMRDTSNEELVLTYTTPAQITPLPTQEFGAATPVEAGEKLESFKLMFQPYTFEDTFYYPEFASTTMEEGYNLLQVVDENSGENIVSFEVEIKWDDDNNYWLENVDPLDITLLDGHIYNVVVPAGMFCCRFEPLHDISLNKEYAVTYNGTYSNYVALNCHYGDAVTITNMVARGESATLKFSLSDEWEIDSVTVNDEPAAIEEDTLVIADLNKTTDVNVAYRFAGTCSFDYTTGLPEVDDGCPYTIALEPGYVVISNVEAGATVEVYNTAGMLMGSSEATDTVMKLNVTPGIVVVVIRNGSDAPVGITLNVK